MPDKRVPLGQPLPLNDNDLDNLALITDQDILTAHGAIVKALSPKYKNLLLADPDDAKPANPAA